MSLLEKIDETKFRTLRFGNDSPYGGSSGQPYIQTDITTVDTPVNRFRLSRFDDGLSRGGAIGRSHAATLDTIRITKFIADFPKGLLFINKQIGLQLSNPKLETKKLPTNRRTTGQGFFQNVGNFFSNTFNQLNNILGPTRIYNSGINTLAQIPLNAIGGHITRHGLLPTQDESTKYAKVVKENDLNDENRLVFLKRNLGDSTIIDRYTGGPDSLYGIGQTIIHRYDYTGYDNNRKLIVNKQNPINEYDKFPNNKINYVNLLRLSQDYKITNNNINTAEPSNKPSQVDAGKYDSYQDLRNEIENTIYKNGRKPIINGLKANEFNIIDSNTIINYPSAEILSGYSPAYKNTQSDIIYYNGVKTVTIKGSWRTMNRENRIGSGKEDLINLTPIFSSVDAPGTRIKISGKEFNVRDLIKFRIEAVNTDNPEESDWMIFRSYITAFSDGYNPEWNNIRYLGRGENFFIYNGFNREITINFQVAALSEAEMKPMYQKLNYLASNTAPDYNSQGFMRGPFMRLTVGNYLLRQPGIIRSLSYSISKDIPWEIAIDDPEEGDAKILYELPHVIEVNMSFTPVHNFLPRKHHQADFIIDKVTKDNIKNPWLNNLNIPKID